MTNNVGRDLKSIVLGDEETTITTEETGASGGFPSSRGVGTSSGAGVSFGGTIASTDDPASADTDGDSSISNLTDSSSSNSAGGTFGDGSSTNPADFTRSPDDGVESAADVIDGEAGPTPADATNPFGSTESLAGIDATDCASGKDLNVRLDGLYPPIPATDYSAEWLDPNTPPIKLGYEEGFFWRSTTPSALEYAYPNGTEVWVPVLADNNRGPVFLGDGSPGSTYGPNTFSQYYNFVSYSKISATQYEFRLQQADMTGSPIGPEFGGIYLERQACPGGPYLVCPAEPPRETQWPPDDKITLTYSGGKFRSNQYDSDVTTDFDPGLQRSSVSFCMPGGRFGTLTAGVKGGSILYETASLYGAPKAGTTARYYNKEGNLIDSFDATTAKINQYRPKASD